MFEKLNIGQSAAKSLKWERFNDHLFIEYSQVAGSAQHPLLDEDMILSCRKLQADYKSQSDFVT